MSTLHARFQRFVATGPHVILGSASSPRRQIMDDLVAQFPGLTYQVKTADIDEKAIRCSNPHDLVLLLGRAKRDAILQRLGQDSEQVMGAASGSGTRHARPGGPFLITCDQVVLHQGRILEKPESEQECREFIRGYGLDPPSTVGSVVCTDVSSGYSCEAVDVSTVVFKPIHETVIDQYIEDGQWQYCAGGLMYEHPLVVPFVERIEGTDCGVRGLAKALVLRLLLEAAGSGKPAM